MIVIDHHEAEAVIAQHVDSLLSQWHAWSAAQSASIGYPTTNCTCRMARASRQYDDQNGGLDAHVDSVLMQAVDSVVDSIAQPHQTALHILARNLHTRAAVWSSPRLPSDQMQRAALVAQARAMFTKALDRRGML
jgi:hypothetical protein